MLIDLKLLEHIGLTPTLLNLGKYGSWNTLIDFIRKNLGSDLSFSYTTSWNLDYKFEIRFLFLPIFASDETNIHRAMINGNSTLSNST